MRVSNINILFDLLIIDIWNPVRISLCVLPVSKNIQNIHFNAVEYCYLGDPLFRIAHLLLKIAELSMCHTHM